KGNERWLVTYADMVTLMWIFFIVMYALSARISAENWEKLSKSLKSSLNSKNKTDIFSTPQPNADKGQFSEARQKVKQAIAKFDGKSSVRIDLTDRGMVISLADTAFFEKGEVAVKPTAHKVLLQIGQSLLKMPNAISIEGHTDNVPASGKYDSNWVLSAVRAANVIDFLVDQAKIPSRRFQLVSYAEYRPLFPNDTEIHRALNRRVDIVISEAAPQNALTPPPTTPPDELLPPVNQDNVPNPFASGSSSNPGGGGFDNPFGGAN
ncbi:MAG TPA: flagellar motor protein MotB, partial [Chroococcales cyanobacterium]